MAKTFWLAALFGVLSATSAQALYCGTKLVLDGYTTGQVAQLCGPPQSQSHSVYYVAAITGYAQPNIPVAPRGPAGPGFPGQAPIVAQIPVELDEWIYNFGPLQFMQQLRFENDRLVSVTPLGYGD